ncbi:MAG: STAS domain-containing protein [Acidobacteria bacterium]|nr:STAS domain-containing protein [Acidobacteriota bacterium]
MNAGQFYQHDQRNAFRFVLRGPLDGKSVQELEQAWVTARSTIGTREVVVDVSRLTALDSAGFDLLSRMRESGARLTAERPPESPSLIRELGVSAAPKAKTGWRSGLW